MRTFLRRLQRRTSDQARGRYYRRLLRTRPARVFRLYEIEEMERLRYAGHLALARNTFVPCPAYDPITQGAWFIIDARV